MWAEISGRMGEEHQSKGEGEEKMDSSKKNPEIWSWGSAFKYKLGSRLTLFFCKKKIKSSLIFKKTSQNQDQQSN